MSMRTAALRIGLLTASSIFFYVGLAVWTMGQTGTAPLNLGLSAITWLCGVLSAALALLPSVSRRVAWLVLVSFIVLAFQTAYFTSQNYSPQTVVHSDNEMIGKFALEALKRGQNPYEWNFSDSTRVYRDIGLNLTPFLDGSYQYRLTYPALPLLVLWTFDRIGLGQVRIVNFVFLLVLVILIFLGTPEKLRPLSLLPLLVLNSFTGLALSGAQDVVWCALLVCMILVWKRPLLRAILFGLAAAFHQQPWLVAPFLLIVLWHGGGTLRQRLRRIGYFVGISLGLFLLINLPFIVMDYRAWVLGAFEPAYAAFNMFSHGLGIVSMYGILHLPREFYTALQVAFYAVAIFVHGRHPRAVGPMFWLFPAIFFWLFYRGLINYWVFWIPPLLVAMARAEYVHLPALVSHRWRVTAGVSLVMLTLPTALGVYYATSRPLITATLELPIVTSYGGGLSDKLSVTVTNSDDRAFRPRFAVQRDPGGQALPWSILSGPDSIAPSTTVEYVIGNNNNYLTAASTSESAQVVVSDADGSYQRRALVTVPADTSTASPDLIHNPAFTYWNDGVTLPISWTLHTSDTVTTKFQQIADLQALELTIQPSSEDASLVSRLDEFSEFSPHPKPLPRKEGGASRMSYSLPPVKRGRVRVRGISYPVGIPSITRLTQHITFPGSLSIWVHPSVEVSPSSSEVYGLETDDGYHRLWILFGSTQQQTITGPINHAVVYQPAPLGAWSRQTIDLQALYESLGWKLPPFSVNPDHPVRQIDLSLIASSSQQPESTWLFGPIEQDRDAVSLDHLVADALDHPEQYYVYIGNRYYVQRNYEQALQAYTTALGYDPESADAYFGVAQCKWKLRDTSGGMVAIQKALSFWLTSLEH